MELTFDVGGQPAVFRRNDWTGKATLTVGTAQRMLQSPWNPATHASLRLRKVWSEDIAGHAVEIVKTRPRMWGGLREQHFEIRVDGHTVVEGTGK
jgi:hypothetical protein